MTEFKRNGDNAIASNRIPLFVKEFVYNEWNESFIQIVLDIGLMKKVGLLIEKWKGKIG